MKIQIRNDKVTLDGYVNAVERESKVIHEDGKNFVEIVQAGAFQRALDMAKRMNQPVKVLLNHDYNRQLSDSTKVNLREDAIGLHFTGTIDDPEVVKDAREGKLSGWSFGFRALKDEWTEGTPEKRTIREMWLPEVSLLDNTKIPAYDGTSVEMRAENVQDIETRSINDAVELEEDEGGEPSNDLWKYENRYLDSLI